jgi:hypothetical protein
MEACADRYVHYLTQQLVPKVMSVEEIQQESMKDEELTQVRDCIQSNRSYQLPQSYKFIADELCVNNEGIVLRGSRIVLPVKLRKRAIEITHEDHAGMTK